MQRTVFFVSDGTAITTETMGHTLLTQFKGIDFEQIPIPFVDDMAKAENVVNRINKAGRRDQAAPIVFTTVVDKEVSRQIARSQAVVVDLLGAFIGTLEQALGQASKPAVGKAHGVGDMQAYDTRMEAINYALNHDDGMNIRYDTADLILVGVSRSGKTPTCIYLAFHFGLKAANYPLTDDDLEAMRLPGFLRRHKNKLFGLTIDSERLRGIRETRKPGSRYASSKQCRWEVTAAEDMLRLCGVPVLSSTHTSVEELASRIMQQMGLVRELH